VLSGLGNSDPRGAEGFQGGFLVIIRENPNQPASRLLLIVLIFSGDHATARRRGLPIARLPQASGRSGSKWQSSSCSILKLFGDTAQCPEGHIRPAYRIGDLLNLGVSLQRLV
jgi:hypothetical protein